MASLHFHVTTVPKGGVTGLCPGAHLEANFALWPMQEDVGVLLWRTNLGPHGDMSALKAASPDAGHHNPWAPNVSHDRILPLRRPMVSHRTRWAADPCVKLSGMTTPCDCLCSRSSPMAAAVLIA